MAWEANHKTYLGSSFSALARVRVEALATGQAASCPRVMRVLFFTTREILFSSFPILLVLAPR